MYSGTTLTRYSGRILGAHQKIDRVAYRYIKRLGVGDHAFPGIRQILHFEGKNGPDAIKRKSPAKDEPWHYYSPFDDSDSQLTDLISEHYALLVQELRSGNKERIAFEAAWLAHAIVDGLTPAHHFPYEDQLTALRGGEGIESRTSIKEKLIIPGANSREIVRNNWKMWGPKGLFTTHGLFEMGVAFLIKPLSLRDGLPTKREIDQVKKIGTVELFRRSAREIAVLDMYDRYYETGWNTKLAYEVRHKLGPTLAKVVALSWYLAMYDAGLIQQ